jgi:hypothetical protein
MGVLSDQERADSGFGLGLVGGYRFPMSGARSLGVELGYEWSGHTNPTSHVDAKATRLTAQARLSFNADENLVPFAVAGGGLYSLEFDKLASEYDLSGLGLLMGGGAEYVHASGFFARAELGLHIWDAAEESGAGGVAETLTLSLGAAYSF